MKYISGTATRLQQLLELDSVIRKEVVQYDVILVVHLSPPLPQSHALILVTSLQSMVSLVTCLRVFKFWAPLAMQARTNQQAQENRRRKRAEKERQKVTLGPHGHGSIFLGLRSSAVISSAEIAAA